jgi:hypothetical protein
LRTARGAAKRTEEATHEAELRAGVLAVLGTDDYGGLTVAEVTERLDGLSADELKKLREFEKRNKDRETLLERIDRHERADAERGNLRKQGHRGRDASPRLFRARPEGSAGTPGRASRPQDVGSLTGGAIT